MNPLIVIVGINHWDDITHIFLDSIFKFEENPRIVLVDNASDKPYAHDRCWIERSEKRLSFPAAINLALENTLQWDKVAVFNNDCWANEKFIDRIAACNDDTFYGSKWNQPVKDIPLVYSA